VPQLSQVMVNIADAADTRGYRVSFGSELKDADLEPTSLDVVILYAVYQAFNEPRTIHNYLTTLNL